MFKVEKVEVSPKRDKFGIEHKLYISGDTQELKNSFERFSSAENFQAEGKKIKLSFNKEKTFSFELDKPLEDYYNEEIHTTWKEMVASAMGTEEPFRFYSFYTTEGEHLGTVAFKQDCETFLPIILVYKDF